MLNNILFPYGVAFLQGCCCLMAWVHIHIALLSDGGSFSSTALQGVCVWNYFHEEKSPKR
jgi:hypothetical protein